MTFVKICGLRTVEHALVAVEAGADLLGFILAPSRRQIDPEDVAAIGAAVRAAAQDRSRPVQLVGVFVNETPARMLEIADQCRLDILQLSGDEHSTLPEDLPDRALIKAVRQNQTKELLWTHHQPSPRVRLLVDAHVPGSYGGAGVLADWDYAAHLARQAGREILLAGGLTPDNVGAAIRRVRPWGVDVSSGVETDGVKDSVKIRAFVAAARAVDNQIVGAHASIQ
jgi:phosphoribosylanthranilate isomerase